MSPTSDRKVKGETTIETRITYILDQADLKQMLGLDGEIIEMGLWRGRSPKEEQEGKPTDGNEWFVITKTTVTRPLKKKVA